MKKRKMCEKIGNFFGTFSVAGDGKLCIDNGDGTFYYTDEDALLTDWLETLIEHQRDGGSIWEEEIKYIYSDVLHSHPCSVYPVNNRDGVRWKSAGYGPDGGKQQYHLGTYVSIVDAISAQWEFNAFKHTHNEAECREKAEELKARANAAIRAGA